MKISPRHAKFVEEKKEWTDKEIQLSQVYYQIVHMEQNEKIRSNLSKLVWWLIVLPFVFGAMMLFMGALAI